jgi:hypothetical protein
LARSVSVNMTLTDSIWFPSPETCDISSSSIARMWVQCQLYENLSLQHFTKSQHNVILQQLDTSYIRGSFIMLSTNASVSLKKQPANSVQHHHIFCTSTASGP